MTMAISKAVEEGAKAVVCGSTGNTSASAAAYAARAGMTCAVLIPEGYIALGQAGPGPRPRRPGPPDPGQLRPGARHRARAARARRRSRSSTRSTPTASRARRPAPSRSSTCWATRPTSTASPSATPATSPPTGRATASTRTPAGRPAAPDAGLPGGRGGAHRARATRSTTPRRSPPPSASATRPAGTGRPPRRRESGGAIAAVTDDEILEAYRYLAHEESVFCEPASAASVAGLLKTGVPRGSTVVCVLTGHGLKDPDIAISQIAVPTVVDADLAAVMDELSL